MVVVRPCEWQPMRNFPAVEQSLAARGAIGSVSFFQATRTGVHAISRTMTPPMVSEPQVFNRRVKWSFSSIFRTRHCIALLSPSANSPKKKRKQRLRFVGIFTLRQRQADRGSLGVADERGRVLKPVARSVFLQRTGEYTLAKHLSFPHHLFSPQK